MPQDITVCLYEPSDAQEIKTKWCDLFHRSDTSPFLGWSWISSWLHSLPVLPVVLEAKYDHKIVGLALLCKTDKVIFPGFKIRQLWLHRFGQQEYDQVWIEHNDFLLDKEHAETTRHSMTSFLSTHNNLWDELYLGMATEKVVNLFGKNLVKKRIDISSPSFIVDLREKQEIKDYLSDLSKNTRSQISRTQKLLEKQGTLELTWIQNHLEKMEAFEEVSTLHQEKWGTTEFGSGFSNPKFVTFHKSMLATDNDVTRLYCLRLDKVALAYIYIVKDDSDWYFYLSAIKSSDDNRIKIGLLAHTLVIEEAINYDANCYSFLAGEARYKRSMSNTPESLQQLVCFYRPSFLVSVREILRKIKGTFSSKPLPLTKSN